MKTVVRYLFFLTSVLTIGLNASAQNQVTSITLAPDQLGTVQTAVNITTKMSFPDAVASVICGDLYDATSQRGTFVIQSQSNDKDVFIKPVQKQGNSNIFVKTSAGKTYNLKVIVVPQDKANIVVNIYDPKSPSNSDPQPNTNGTGGRQPENASPNSAPCITEADLARRKDEIEQAAQRKADDITRKAREDSLKMVNDAEARSSEILRNANERAEKAGQERFKQAFIQGVQRIGVENTRASSKKVSVQLDSNIWIFDGRAYLHYTIQNTGDVDFAFSAISLTAGSPKGTPQPIPVELTQQKAENTLIPKESLAGVITFDAKMISPKDRLELSLRDADNVEVIKLKIQ